MCRKAWRPLLLALALAIAGPAAVRGQEGISDENPLDGAKARGLRRPEARVEDLRDAARTASALRVQRVMAGSDTPDMTVADLARLLAADLAAAKTPADRIAARERYWAGCRLVELLILERVMANIKQFTAADYYAARTERLLAAASLAEEVGQSGRPAPGAVHSARDDSDPLDSRAPRDEFEATRAEPRRLARAARDNCDNELAVRSQRIRAGTDTPDVIQPIGGRRLAATRAAGANPAEYLAAIEAVWSLNRDVERLTQERVEAGIKQFTTADYYEARDHRLEASVLMAEARGGAGKPLPLQGGLQHPFYADDPLSTRQVARAKAAETRADVGQLNRRRREAILAEYVRRIQRVRAGSDTPDVISQASRRLLEVELALAGGKAERLAALERYWTRAAELEALTRERVESGIRGFTSADLLETTYDRLRAELRLAEARAAGE
jgi:hypothetical protein